MIAAWALACLVVAAAPAPAQKSAAKEVRVQRKHQVGQKYDVSFTSESVEMNSKLAFTALATVKSVSPEATDFDVVLPEILLTEGGAKPLARKVGNVKLKVRVEANSIDAEVTDPGNAGAWAELHLTAYELMMGDVCQPPPEPLQVGKPLDKGTATWELLSVKDGVATLKSTPAPKDGSPYTCEVTVSLDDGYAGTRTSTARLDLHAADPRTGKPMIAEQRYVLKVKRK